MSVITDHPTPMSSPSIDEAPPSSPPPEVATVPTERIEAEICELAAHLAAGEARWLELIAEFDRRKGCESWGLASCAQWLSWKCGLAPNAARERVRVAHALTELRQVQGLFASGRLSYSKVRAITRVATAETEATLVELAKHATASQLERIVRAWRRCLEPYELDRAARQREQRKLTWGYNDDGCVVGSFCLPSEEGKILMKAVEVRLAPPLTREERDVSAETSTVTQRRADALVEVADASLSGTVRSGDERVMVVIEVDEQVLADRHGATAAHSDAVEGDAPDGDAVALPGLCVVQDGPAIAAETARRLACDSTEIRLVRGEDGTAVNESLPTKTIPRKVRRAMRRRDNDRCVFPGCETEGWVEAHHLIHRADGGTHELQNLATLCKRHHHLVHEGGFSIETHDDGQSFQFYRPDGQAIPVTGEATAGSHTVLVGRNTQHCGPITPSTLWGGTGERLDLELTIWAMCTNHLKHRNVSAETSSEPE